MLHDTLSLGQEDMAALGLVVQTFMRTMFNALPALFLQQTGETPPDRLGVAAGLHDFVEHIAVLIDSAPEPMLPA
jgi:hypothetical protein